MTVAILFTPSNSFYWEIEKEIEGWKMGCCKRRKKVYIRRGSRLSFSRTDLKRGLRFDFDGKSEKRRRKRGRSGNPLSEWIPFIHRKDSKAKSQVEAFDLRRFKWSSKLESKHYSARLTGTLFALRSIDHACSSHQNG